MGILVLKDGFLIFKVCVFACFLVLQGYAVVSPDGDATPGPDSQGILASSPIMPPRPPDVFLHPPPSSAPISSALPPERVKGPIVPVFPPTYLLMPPSIAVTPPVNTSGNTTGLAPSVPPGNPEHAVPPIPGTPAPSPLPPPGNPEHADPPIPGTPAPFPSPPPGNPEHADPPIPGTPAPFPSPPPGNPEHADPPIPGTPAPFPSPSTASPNNPSISPGLSPVSLSPPSHGNGSTEIPVFPAPSPDAVSGISPIMPPTHSVMPEISPSRFPVPAVLPHMPPNMLPGDPSHVQPALPAKPPSILSEPAASPVPSINIPPPPSKSPKAPASPASRPSTSVVRHHNGANNQSSIAPPLYRGSPPASPKQDPKINNSFYGPPPRKSVSSISPYASASPPSMRQYYLPPSLSQPVPFISPKMSPSGSSPRIPKLPRQPSYQGLPPPPPNEDCVSLTCSEPLTIGPPGTPCVCVLPMQVGLRLSVALYTFFPLVSEFAAETAIGVFLKSSQVRIMGANVASEDSEKTIVLLDLVPLGEGFDNATSYLMSRRLWQKEVVIDASLFGNYEVLYVRYPGLPPSPPVDVNFVNSDPYNGHGNGAAIKPLGVDVGRKQHKGGPSKSVIAIIILSVSLAVIFGSVIAWFLVFRCRDLCEQESTPPVKLPSSAKSAGIGASGFGSPHSSASLSLPSSIAAYTGSAKTFTSSEIERATENFNEARVIGEGGFGRVYLGVLQDETEVAVKVLKRADQQGGREFLAEVEMLSRLHHRNLVKLTGICTEERTRCLVYELIPNGSVESHLHGIHRQSAPLDWAARLKIALGAARGLAYLHEDSSPRVIHRDFKSSNILLEHDFTPKVSDFGLARTALEEENKHISTRVMGTFGYVAPEYAMTGHLLVKSDVYSYGVVLLELLTGRKPVDMSQPPGQENLVSWIRPLLTSEEGLESIIDPSLGPDFPYDSISKVAAIASMCVQPEVSHRPFMGEVVQALKLVCSDCDETTELGSVSFSHEDASFGNTSGHLHHPMRNEFPASSYDSEVDVERGLSGSYLLDSSTRYVKQDSGSLGRYSSSGPLRTGNTMRLWQKARLLSGGSFSDHSMMFNSWQRSH